MKPNQTKRSGKLMFDVTVNLASSEFDLEGEASSFADLGPAIERLIAKSGKLKPGRRWTSLAVSIVA